MRHARIPIMLLAVVASLVFVSAAWASYWFFQGDLSGTTLKGRDSTGTQYGRQSFDNTNHQGHTQYVVFILSSGTWNPSSARGRCAWRSRSGMSSGIAAVPGLWRCVPTLTALRRRG